MTRVFVTTAAFRLSLSKADAGLKWFDSLALEFLEDQKQLTSTKSQVMNSTMTSN